MTTPDLAHARDSHAHAQSPPAGLTRAQWQQQRAEAERLKAIFVALHGELVDSPLNNGATWMVKLVRRAQVAAEACDRIIVRANRELAKP